jgi:aldose 1-epimerase
MITLTSSDGLSVATINPVGAALAELWQGATQIAGSPDIYSGVTLFPWPNRILGGVWNHQGKQLRLSVNDVQQNAALHGLVYEERFDWVQESSKTCSLSLDLEPSEGYPFSSRLRVTFVLDQADLKITQEVVNVGKEVLPFAIGFHPYFIASDDCHFESPSFEFQLADVHVDKTVGPKCNKVRLTTSTYSLDFSADNTGYFHIFTNRYDEPGRIWFAMEPQTAPADSLNTGTGVTELSPGESTRFIYRLNWR